ncbi:hypothetical protein ACFYUY_23930 [Kitasatospora sp. NPDC004745]|uniref:hypothetical protein n=1 Tax=Kitasatospora sp. NPDC004745 TaxID=3364019 RepID=UPI00368EA43D
MSESNDGAPPAELEPLLADAVATQRQWFEAETGWTQDPTNRERYEAFIAAGLQLHNHSYWAAAGGNRFELEKAVRTAAQATGA